MISPDDCQDFLEAGLIQSRGLQCVKRKSKAVEEMPQVMGKCCKVFGIRPTNLLVRPSSRLVGLHHASTDLTCLMIDCYGRLPAYHLPVCPMAV